MHTHLIHSTSLWESITIIAFHRFKNKAERLDNLLRVNGQPGPEVHVHYITLPLADATMSQGALGQAK